MLDSDLFVAITVFLACAVLYLVDPSWETIRFVITMMVLYSACLWLKTILKKDGNKTRTV
jgi:hypothetical protein